MDKNKVIIVHMITEAVEMVECSINWVRRTSMFRVCWEKNWLNFYLMQIDYKDCIPKNYI
jgi:hypothetical protein